MTNPARGEEVLALSDGREFTLVMDFEALVAAETAYGQPMAILITDWVGGFVGAMRCLLFGCLRTNHRDITLLDAGEIIQADAKAVSVALTAADAKAQAKPSEDKKPGKARPPRGKISGNSGAKRVSTRKPSGDKRRARSS